jgi:hypothetical protein
LFFWRQVLTLAYNSIIWPNCSTAAPFCQYQSNCVNSLAFRPFSDELWSHNEVLYRFMALNVSAHRSIATKLEEKTIEDANTKNCRIYRSFPFHPVVYFRFPIWGSLSESRA